MKFTKSDFKETAELAPLLTKIDNINTADASLILDEIFQRQPFFLSVLLGYRMDVKTEEFEEIISIYLLIWEYFKINKKIPTGKITEADFEKIETRYIEMFKYVEGETDQKEISNIYDDEFEKIKSRSLLAAVLFRLKTRPVLIKMDIQTKGIILVGIKSFIECFEQKILQV